MKRTEPEWRTLFAEHAASGLSAAAYCRQHQLCPKYFSLRRRQLGWVNDIDQSQSPDKSSEHTFVQASLSPAPTPAIEITHQSLTLRLPPSMSADWVAALVKQLTP